MLLVGREDDIINSSILVHLFYVEYSPHTRVDVLCQLKVQTRARSQCLSLVLCGSLGSTKVSRPLTSTLVLLPTMAALRGEG
jgi:hypothetical protein